MEFNETTAKLALAKLKERHGKFKCPYCHSESEFNIETNEFQVLGYNTVEEEFVGDEINYIPVVVNICPHCGFVAKFALNALGVE